ncbi:uncharacterized protein LOC120894479 [Anopheles arabiensis]|uniref:FERM domain-containing protein 8 n=1 Tax=Anopheles arabiensis TaxID=7173 RepID=A0A2Y9D0U4_ANOAR|nr:uncharacterized protein LOC120894479 [Anopheles arabiensis]XP_040153013.1 uncharacterized protein LOC120894479 [Anopheles arabiensis]XP_040153014.1 uncharacterized protein LOC120894479 [Anopheles arabiensis]XP_040153015.1 uncharacterized protein LOC120894479 [Anopheles arabiensis]XP_040153016.1 uncharacterized protein LOC120894479 [Anopheles arabiensis]XP_040153018.1 uncharacterized protein LOC120894479 [Anopheles arabiensis]
MPVGNVSYYHRRKYSPQAPPDHQSRIFFGDYARPDGGSERSRSNGSISSVATTQSSSSCVSVHSSAASLADAANANLLAVVSAPQGVESDSSPVPKCVDSAGSCGGGGGIGTTTTTTTTTTSSGSNCCVRAAAAAGESGSVGASQQVPSSRTCASESATGYEGQRGTVVRAGGSYHSGGGSIGVVNSGNISGNGQQRRVASGANSSNSSGGGSVNSTNKSKDQANGQLLLSPAGAGTTSSATSRSAPLQPVKSASFAVAGSGLLAGGSLAPGGTSYSQVSSSTFGTSRLGSNEEQRSQLSPGPVSNTTSGSYQLSQGNGNETLLHQPKASTTTGNSNSAAKQQQHLYSKQQPQPQQQQKQLQQSTASVASGPNLPPNVVASYPSSSSAAATSSGLWSEDNPFVVSSATAQQQQQQQQQLPPHSSGVNVNVTVNVVARPVTASTMTTTTATTTSTTTLAPPRPMQKVIPTVVYLMSRIAVHMEIEGTAQCPAQVMLAAALGCEELGITNKLLAQSVFGLWMTSPLLEVQLKPHHRPYAVRVAWSKLLDKHSHGNELEKLSDEPMTTLRRNVFFSRRDEEKIKDPRILELLYEEARHNVLLGRYVMEPSQSIMLGGIQARIELGPYNSHTHTTSYFRENQFRFLPAHVAKSSSWSWLPISQRSSAEVRLLEQFKRVPTTATTKKLMRKYLEFCWGLPFYGAAYFHGQVEQPVRGLMSLMQQKDLPVLIAVNERGIFVIDQIECTLLLGLKYEEFSWEYAKPSNVNDPECLPCIFLQFGAVENGIAATKLMQIFSRQAAMVDALITHFIEQDKRRKESGADADQAAGGLADNTYVETNPIKNNGIGVLSNKFARLTLATFDDEGRCIGQTGSLSISY